MDFGLSLVDELGATCSRSTRSGAIVRASFLRKYRPDDMQGSCENVRCNERTTASRVKAYSPLLNFTLINHLSNSPPVMRILKEWDEEVEVGMARPELEAQLEASMMKIGLKISY